MTEQSMPKDERADALLVLKKLLENNPAPPEFRHPSCRRDHSQRQNLLGPGPFQCPKR
jgi:hypothetical protein